MSIKAFITAVAIATATLSLTANAMAQTPQQMSAAQRAGAAMAEEGRRAMLPRQTVRVREGQVRGYVENDVAAFMGLPYAAPPVGDLRWRSPQPAARWSGVRDAVEAGGSCQREEDCLYLNVQRPEGARAGADLPVMVWIHGGSFRTGQGANYDGTEFVKKGVVVVTINYRMGRAGWFAHPALTAEGQSGNFGTEDQIASLRWVQDNIRAFGGDPDNVTIFGESAGAISVMYITLNQDAHGLFARAIVESGFPRNQPTPLAVAEEFGARAAAAQGVSGTGPEAAAALRRIDIDAIPASDGYFDATRAYPILDGDVIRWSMIDGYEGGHQSMTPLMIGGTSNDASLYRVGEDEYAAIPNQPAMLRVFNPSGGLDNVQVVNDYWTAQRMTEPDRHIARLHAATGQPTFLYYFSYVPPERRESSRGAGHASEISYVFGTLRGEPGPEDVATSQAMNAYWAAFAKYDDPASAGGPDWPQFSASNEALMDFANDGVVVRRDFMDAQLDFVEAAPWGP